MHVGLSVLLLGHKEFLVLRYEGLPWLPRGHKAYLRQHSGKLKGKLVLAVVLNGLRANRPLSGQNERLPGASEGQGRERHSVGVDVGGGIMGTVD
jgi:hypothetical protein